MSQRIEFRFGPWVSFVPLAVSRLYGKKASMVKEKKRDPISRVEGRYGGLLGHVLSHRWIIVIALILGIGAALAAALAMPTDFMAQNDQSQIEVSIKAPVGSNLEETGRYADEAIAQIEKAIPKNDRRLIAAEVGAGDGFSAIFSEGLHSGTIRIPLVKVSKRDTSQAEYEAAVREHLAAIPDLTFSIGRQNLTGSGGELDVNIHGHDLDALRRIGKSLKEILAGMPEMAEVQFSFADPTPQINVNFERDKLSKMGISPAAVSQTVATFFLGKTAALYSDGDDEHSIYVRYDKAYRRDVEEIRRVPVSTPSGAFVPLANIANISFGPGPVSITRIDQQRVVTLSCVLKDEFKGKDGALHAKDLGGTISRVRNLLEEYEWPEETGFEVGGTAEDFIESFQALGLALIVSIFLVYMVMASQFESFREPFVIIFTMPLALIGVVLMFSFTQTTVDVAALIGVIMLVGIVVNNGIVMVDAANRRRNAGADKNDAILSAAKTRLRPVLLTSMTTICSMIPLAMKLGEGSETWSGMARSVIGGLTSATLLTLVVIPVFYTIFAKKEVKV
jgi:HAE1 family hydrophobic/amphiphilic exporter-1